MNTLAEIGKIIEEYRTELEEINKEEVLFAWEISQFPMLQTIISTKDPYDKLWNTLYNFQVKEIQWLKGDYSH